MTNFLRKFNTVVAEATGKAFEDATIAVFAGSFKPPHAGDWKMIKELAKNADMSVVFISNVTKEYLCRQPLDAEWIFESLESLKKKLKKDFNAKRVDIIFDKLKEVKDIDWNKMMEILAFTDFEIGKTAEVQDAMKSIQEKLFVTLAKHSLDGTYETTITPETSKKIFDIYNKDKSDNIHIIVSSGMNQARPMISAIQWVDENCRNCKILLCSADEDRGESRWNTVDIDFNRKDKNGNTFDLINKDEMNFEKTILSSKSIKAAIQNGEWNSKFLPSSLSEDEKNKVCELILTNSKKDDSDATI